MMLMMGGLVRVLKLREIWDEGGKKEGRRVVTSVLGSLMLKEGSGYLLALAMVFLNILCYRI